MLPRLLAHLRYLLDDGCDAINLLGTTGEANSFSLRAALAIMGAVKDRPACPWTGSWSAPACARSKRRWC